MRSPTFILATLLFAACASKAPSGEGRPAPDSGPPPATSPGEVVHVNADSGMVIVRTAAAAGVIPGSLVAIDFDAAPSAVIRVGSADNGMVAGVLESGTAAEGPCRVTPLR